MTADPASTRSRRALLAAALGAGAATLASALARPLPARAAGPAITVGDTVTGSATTTLDISGAANANAAFWALSDGGVGLAGTSNSDRGVAGASDGGTGVQGTSNAGTGVVGLGSTAGVRGTSAGGFGVQGQSTSGTGVSASSVSGSGVYATSDSWYAVGGVSQTGTGVRGDSDSAAGVEGNSGSGPGVFGGSTTRTGVQGFSGSGSVPGPQAKTGVHGYAAADASAVGVHGQTTSGTGVRAAATTGTALLVVGKASFSRSGRTLVGAGKAYVDVTVPGGVVSTALCFANLAVYRSGVTVAAVRPAYPTAGKMRIYLNKAIPTATNVAWIVMG
jgi:hypothetical protein